MIHTRLIDRWTSLSDFASDIGVAYGTAKAMRRRGSIPVAYWPALIAAAKERGIEDITYKSLVEAHVAKTEAAA